MSLRWYSFGAVNSCSEAPPPPSQRNTRSYYTPCLPTPPTRQLAYPDVYAHHLSHSSLNSLIKDARSFTRGKNADKQDARPIGKRNLLRRSIILYLKWSPFRLIKTFRFLKACDAEVHKSAEHAVSASYHPPPAQLPRRAAVRSRPLCHVSVTLLFRVAPGAPVPGASVVSKPLEDE